MTTELVIPLFFVAIGLIVAAGLLMVRDLFFRSRSELQQRLGELSGPSLTIELEPDQGRGITRSFDRWFERLIADSGMELSPLAAFLLAVAVGILVGGGLFLWRESAVSAILGMFAGLFATVSYFAYRRHRRRLGIQNQLPDAVEAIARAVKSGKSFEQAVELAATTATEPIAGEFHRIGNQLEFGLSVEAAMQALTRRMPMLETRILAATVVVQRRSGGNLPLTLQRLANVFRDRLSFRRQFRAATAIARFSAVVICGVSIATAVYMIVFQPDYIHRFVETPRGQVLLMVAVGLEVLGLAMLLRLAKTDY